MIEQTYELVKSRLNSVYPMKVCCHLPGHALLYAEQELLLDMPYERHTPDAYPFGEMEKVGCRSIREAANGQYLNMHLRVGTTTLHVREKESDANIDAIVLIYMGELIETIQGPSEAQAHKLSSSIIMLMLETGIISTTYLPSPAMAIVDSCYPEGKVGYAAYPYPKDKGAIVSRFEMITSQHPRTRTTKAYRAIPDLVMLAVDANKIIEDCMKKCNDKE